LFGIAEIELQHAKERQAAGIALARKRGVYTGRRPGTTKAAPSRARTLKKRWLKVARQAVKLPDYNGGNLSGKNGGLQLLERFPLYGGPAFMILKPLHRFVPVTLEPRL
jgi:hypothetical protein